MTVAICTVKPGGIEAVVTKRPDSVADQPAPPVAVTAGEAGIVSPAGRAAGVAVDGAQALTVHTATSATNLRSSTIPDTQKTQPFA